MAEAMNGQRPPPMPSMAGANMGDQGVEFSPEAKQNMMKPSPEIGAIIMARLGSMTEEQLEMLDRAISPEAAQALLMILPELAELIGAIEEVTGPDEEAMMAQAAPAPRQAAPAPRQAPPMGALGGMA